MKRSLMMLAASVLLAGSAWADQPERVAAAMDPSEVEIIAVQPRNPEVKPMLLSLPARDDNPDAAGTAGPDDRQPAVEPPRAVKPRT